MLFSAVIVISCVISSVVSVVDFEDNVIHSEDSLQDLLTRTKKSPDIIVPRKNTWDKDNQKIRKWKNSPDQEENTEIQQSGTSDSEVSAEITTLLAKDIKKKLNDLEELENAYKKLKSDSLNRERATKPTTPEMAESLNSKIKSFLESKLSDDKILDEKETIRIARQYGQNAQHYQSFNGKGIMPAENAYSDNGRYRGLSDSSVNMYGDRGDPYLAQYNPSARTYEENAYAYGGDKKKHEDPLKPLKQLKQIIPNVINALAEITTPVKPVQNSVSESHSVHPQPTVHTAPVHPPVKHEHKPLSGLHIQEHKHKELSTIPMFFSKQLIFGIGTDKKIDNKNYGYGLPQEHGYQPYSYSYSPYGYSYSPYSSSSYWTPLRDDYSTPLNLYPESNAYYPTAYSLSPEGQNIYDPTLDPYSQGNLYAETPNIPNSQFKAYYPVDSNYRSKFDSYRSDEGLPMYKKGDTANDNHSQSQYHLDPSPYKVENLTKDEIESEIKKQKEKIEKIEENLNSVEKYKGLNVKKETELSNNVKLNPSINRRGADSEVNKLCYHGSVNENTGLFDFVEVEC